MAFNSPRNSSYDSTSPVDRMKKWPKKAETRSPLEQRMRITASHAVSRDRLRLQGRGVAGKAAGDDEWLMTTHGGTHGWQKSW